jgi:hypothetical protein
LKNNLILIIDKSSTNLLKRQEEIFQKWKINKEDVVKTTTWRKGLVQSKNLFGGVQAVWLDLSDAQAAMNFSKLIPTKKKLTEEKHLFNGKWWGNGVIITFLYPDKAINGKESSAGLAAIKNLVEYSDGTIEDNSSKRVDTLKTDVLKNIPLNSNIKTQLKEYVGENFEALVMLEKALKKIPKEEIQKFTIQDVAVYLPAKSGVKLPWDVTGALDRHNLALALDCYNRMVNNKVPMFGLISWLNRHYQLAYEVASLLESGVPRRDISKCLPKQNSYAISNTIRDLESNGTYPKAETLEYILKQTTELNLYYKGEVRCIDKDNHFRNVLAKIYQALRCNAPLQY